MLRRQGAVGAVVGLHLLGLSVIEVKTETGLAAERQLDDLQQVARAAHHHVVGLARGLAGVARLRSKGLHLAGLGAAAQLDALTPHRPDLAAARFRLEAVAVRPRYAERRGGKECGRKGRSQWSP